MAVAVFGTMNHNRLSKPKTAFFLFHKTVCIHNNCSPWNWAKLWHCGHGFAFLLFLQWPNMFMLCLLKFKVQHVNCAPTNLSIWADFAAKVVECLVCCLNLNQQDCLSWLKEQWRTQIALPCSTYSFHDCCGCLWTNKTNDHRWKLKIVWICCLTTHVNVADNMTHAQFDNASSNIAKSSWWHLTCMACIKPNKTKHCAKTHADLLSC